jgi:hypothetical protein
VSDSYPSELALARVFRGREFTPNAAGSLARNQETKLATDRPLEGQQLAGEFPNEAMRRQSLLQYDVVSSHCSLQNQFSMDEL